MVVSFERWVDHVPHHLGVAEILVGPVDEVARVLALREAPADDLQKENAEAVDVALEVGAMAVGQPLGVVVSDHARRQPGALGVAGGRRHGHLGDAEIGHLGGVVVREEDGAGVQVEVAGGRDELVVHVREAVGGAHDDAHAGGPIQMLALLVVEVIVQGAVASVFED